MPSLHSKSHNKKALKSISRKDARLTNDGNREKMFREIIMKSDDIKQLSLHVKSFEQLYKHKRSFLNSIVWNVYKLSEKTFEHSKFILKISICTSYPSCCMRKNSANNQEEEFIFLINERNRSQNLKKPELEPHDVVQNVFNIPISVRMT